MHMDSVLLAFVAVILMLAAHSDENGHRFRREAATHSNPKRPLFQRSELTGVIVAVG